MSGQYPSGFSSPAHQGNYPNQMIPAQMRNQMGGQMMGMSNAGIPNQMMMNSSMNFNAMGSGGGPIMLPNQPQQSPQQAMSSPGLGAHSAVNIHSPSSHPSPSSVFGQQHPQHTPPHIMQAQSGGNHTPMQTVMPMASPQHHQMQMHTMPMHAGQGGNMGMSHQMPSNPSQSTPPMMSPHMVKLEVI